MNAISDPRTLLLLILPLGAALIFVLKGRSEKRKGLLPFSGPLGFLEKETKRTRTAFRLLFLATVVALCLMVYVVSRPFELRPKLKRTGEGIDILIALDTSESMDADDFEPSRIDVAKTVIRDFIKRRTEDRIGIIVFSGDAVTKCPLTRDYDFLLSQVEDIHLREMKQGTAIGMGLANGVARLRNSESKTKVIILLTDGDSNVGAINPATAAHLARQEGIKVYTIGIGKANRVVVPIYAYDVYGRRTQLVAQVPSYLNPELLQEIARLTGGKAYMARDPGMLTRFVQEVDSLEKTKVKITKTEEREERYLIPAMIASLLIFIVIFLRETRFRKARVA